MTQDPKGEAAPLIERTEVILNRSGEQLGRLMRRAGLRLQRVTRAFREEANRMDELESTQARQGRERKRTQQPQTHQPTTERAEEMMDQFGQRMNQWMTTSGLQARKVVARLQEEAEDMWAEAHTMRSSWKGEHIQR